MAPSALARDITTERILKAKNQRDLGSTNHLREEGKMKVNRTFSIPSAVLVTILLFSYPCFSQVRKDLKGPYSGVIDGISADYKFITVNEKRFSLSRKTEVVDERGNHLKLYDLRPGWYVTIQRVQNPDGSFEKKIMVRGQRGVRK
jgi:hypothetical protein